MRDFRIDGKTQRVFVLTQTDKALVYIPLKVLTRVDYDRLLENETEAGSGDMLTYMKKKKLNNGRNALALYDSIIQVAKLDDNNNVLASRLIKPDELIAESKKEKEAVEVASVSTNTAEKASSDEAPKKPRGRGRPKKEETQ